MSKWVWGSLLVVTFCAVLALIYLRSSVAPDTGMQFYLAKYAPASAGYRSCLTDGLQAGNSCDKCEALYDQTWLERKSLNIATDNDLIAYMLSQDKDCVNPVTTSK